MWRVPRGHPRDDHRADARRPARPRRQSRRSTNRSSTRCTHVSLTSVAEPLAAPSTHSPVPAAELLNADGNLGPALLSPAAITNIETILDRFQALHIKGVTVEIGFTMLLPAFTDSAGYLSFYEQVAASVHRRGMQLDIEENPAFPGFTSLPVDDSGLTVASYASEQAQEAQTIIDRLAPQYLTLLDETDTFAFHLDLPLDNAQAAVQVVNLELNGLRRGHTAVGAGTGTWMSSAIDQALATRTSIDYLSVHVYPVDAQSLAGRGVTTGADTRSLRPGTRA